jgi:hypothetical protein
VKKLVFGLQAICSRQNFGQTNTVTAYSLQQIQLLAHRDRHSLPSLEPAGIGL